MLKRSLYALALLAVASLPGQELPRPALPPVPTGSGAPLPPSPPTVARGLGLEPAASPIRVLRNSALGAAAAGRQTVASPTALVHGALNNGTALATGNRYAALSTDGGGWWTHVDPATLFPAADGGFAGNQRALHVPVPGIDVWVLQYAYSATTRRNTIRLAVAKNQADLTALSFHRYDFSPASFGFSDQTWLDTPNVAYSGSYLWLAADCFDASQNYVGSVVWRAPLSQIAANTALTVQSARQVGGGWQLTAGAQDTMFWFQHLTTSRLRVYRWPEAASTPSFDDRDVGLWYQGTMDGSGPGGRNWLQRADQRLLAAWVARGRIGVMWHSKEGGSQPRPFTRIVELDAATRDVVRQSTVWSPDFAWAYPSAGVNAKGHLAGSICYGGGAVHPGTAVWIVDDLDPGFEPLQNLVVAAGTASPSGNAWGDYLSSAAHPGRPLTWVATALSMSGAGGDADQSPRLVHFGRDRDVISRPDLVVADITSSNPLNPGFPATVRSTIRNLGSTASAACTSAHYLSADATITTFDLLLEAFATPALAVDGEQILTTNFTVATSTTPGPCWLGVLVDRANEVAEVDETNNVAARGVICQPLRADLVIDALTPGKTQIDSGLPLSIGSVVRNRGLATSVACTSSYYLSVDDVITTADTLLGDFPTPALLPNTTYVHGGSVTIPASAPAGPCWLGVLADRLATVDEAYEDNNARAQQVTCLGARPDLVVEALGSTSSTLRRSQSVGVTSTVRNRGFAVSPSVASGYYLSLDATITTADVLLAAFTTPALQPNAAANHGTNVAPPQSTPIGPCWLGAIADRDDTAGELDESNNARALAVTCEDGVADLVAAQLGAATTTFKRGEWVRVSSTIRNDGFGTTPSLTSGYYLSDDQTITTADRLLASFATVSLVPSASDNHAVDVQVPVAAKLGPCWLGVIADTLDLAKESNETNNARALAVVCADGTPDLVVTVLTPPPLVAGGPLDVVWSVRNQGYGLTAATEIGFFLGATSAVGTGDVLLGTASVPALDINASYGTTTRVLVPYCTPGGQRWMLGVADVGRAVQELDENNNGLLRGPLNCTPYAGSDRYLEFVPVLGGAALRTSEASFRLDVGPRQAKLCVTAPALPRHVYVLVWSGQPHPNLTFDAFTSLSASLANGPVLPFFIGVLDAGGRTIPSLAPTMNLPVIQGLGPLVVHTHQVFLDPLLFTVKGLGSNSVINRLQ